MVRCRKLVKERIMSDMVLAHVQSSGRFGAYLKSLAGRFARYRAYRRTLAGLEALSARELEDLGLTHGTIREVACRSVYGPRET